VVATQDLRSPDTRDAAIARFAPIQAVSGPQPVAQPASDGPWGGSHWVTTVGLSLLVLAAIGGIAALALVARRRSGALVAAVTDGTRDWRRGVGL
jgi:hypothetical protein